MKKITYESKEKRYYLPPLHNYNFNKKETCIIIIINITLLIFSIYSLINTINFSNEKINYTEIGTIDYKIYLKDNTYYQQDYLTKGMNYVANLINYIDIDFKYEAISDIKLNYNYTYNLKKTLYILDNNSTKVLYKNEEIVKDNINVAEIKNNMYILEDLDIDYDYYNNIVTNFKNEYTLSTNSYLQVELNINNEIKSNTINNLTTNSILKLEIPLSKQTVDIKINDTELNNNLTLNNKTKITNYPKFIIYLLISIITICILFIILNTFIIKKNKDIYNKTISNYLKKYDSIIVNAKQPNIDEEKFEEIIRVNSIEELIDVQETSSKPIIFYQVIENEKSYFIVLTKDILYKFTITRAYLERLEKKE